MVARGRAGHHRLQFCHGVHGSAVVGRGVHRGLHRSQVGRGHTRDAQGLQLGLSQGCRACGCAQDRRVSVHHGLHFGGAVGGTAGQASQCAVDCTQVAVGHARDAGVGVVSGGGCGVAAGEA